MLDELACMCDALGCDRPLREADCQLVFQSPEGERRAYECNCGAVTMTVEMADGEEPTFPT